MKLTALTLSLFGLISTLNAQKVALHSTGSIQHFTGTTAFADAYTASNPGDTIYLPGGGFTPPATIDKSLRIYGAGHYPDSTQVTAKTYINGNIALTDNADGFYLEGVDINGQLGFSYNTSIDNVIIKYCKMNKIDVYGNNTFTTPSNNLLFINNVVKGDVLLSNAQNSALYNNIIEARIQNSYGNLIENNIVMFSYTGVSSYYSIHGDNNIVNNNIFLNASNRYFVGVSNQINNNIFIVASPIFGTTPITSGNYYPVTQSSIFISQSGTTFDYSHDYHLQSPSTYLGVDATEVGIYGGFNGYKEGAVPSNPHFQLKTIAPTTNSSGLLNVQINASAQDN
ncbi:MAG: hypothetical protein R2780_13135 [Crocinitomicaceae bacterium]|nr:hypothetical protein [Crocinitomicaceae bacterium]